MESLYDIVVFKIIELSLNFIYFQEAFQLIIEIQQISYSNSDGFLLKFRSERNSVSARDRI